jgi:hypothetical protein
MKIDRLIITLAAICLAACQTQKRVTSDESMISSNAQSIRHDYQSDERLDIWRTLCLDLDSVEVMVPISHLPLVWDMADTTNLEHTARQTMDTRQACAVLKARRAKVSTNSCTTHQSAAHERRVDSLKQTEAATSERHSDVDQVAVSKPPDLTWTIPTVIVIIVSAYLFHKRFYK